MTYAEYCARVAAVDETPMTEAEFTARVRQIDDDPIALPPAILVQRVRRALPDISARLTLLLAELDRDG